MLNKYSYLVDEVSVFLNNKLKIPWTKNSISTTRIQVRQKPILVLRKWTFYTEPSTTFASVINQHVMSKFIKVLLFKFCWYWFALHIYVLNACMKSTEASILYVHSNLLIFFRISRSENFTSFSHVNKKKSACILSLYAA